MLRSARRLNRHRLEVDDGGAGAGAEAGAKELTPRPLVAPMAGFLSRRERQRAMGLGLAGGLRTRVPRVRDAVPQVVCARVAAQNTVENQEGWWGAGLAGKEVRGVQRGSAEDVVMLISVWRNICDVLRQVILELCKF